MGRSKQALPAHHVGTGWPMQPNLPSGHWLCLPNRGQGCLSDALICSWRPFSGSEWQGTPHVQQPRNPPHTPALLLPACLCLPLPAVVGRACNKRTSLQMDSSEHWTAAELVSTSGSTSLSLGSPSDATPKRHMAHRHQQHAHEAAPPQFPVLDYHMQQCQQHQGRLGRRRQALRAHYVGTGWCNLPSPTARLCLSNRGPGLPVGRASVLLSTFYWV